MTISDPGFVGYQQLELWDSKGTLAGGQFVVNGVPQTGGHEIDVSPANVANTVFDAGTAGGTDTLLARLLQNNGTLTAWQQFTVTVPSPTLSVTSIAGAIRGQVINLSDLVTISDPGFVGYQQLELWDSKGTLAGGQFVVNGVPQTGGHEIDVSPANVANTVFDAGTAGGTDTLLARLLQNNGTLTAWQQFTVTVPSPTLSVTSVAGAIKGQVINLSDLVTISDPGFVGYQQLELWDSKGTLAGGQFVVNGVPQTGGHEIDVSPANVANTVFDAGTAGGTDTLLARLLQNNGTLTAWQKFTVTVPSPTLSVTSVAGAIKGQVINLSDLVTISDPGFVGYQQLELWDSKGTLAGGQFVVNGVPQTGGHEIDVSPANVANTVFDAGTAGGTDTLLARLLQNNGTLTAWQKLTVTVPSPTLSVTSVAGAIKGQVINLSDLVTISDPGFVGYQQLELWDSKGTLAGGQFVVNGVPQTGGHEIDVSPANVANTVFDAGTAGGTDTLLARLLQNNGTLTAWQKLTVTVPSPTLSVTSVAGAIKGQVINLSDLVTISDPGFVGYQQLELWDSKGTLAGGQFVVNGVPQTGGHEIDVSPANVANTVFDAGTAGGTDTLLARLLQTNGTLTPWQQFTVANPVTIAAGATIELPSPFVGPVSFAGSSGTLKLDQSQSFAGTIAGFSGQDQIDLADIGYGAKSTLGYLANGNNTGGTLTINDGNHTATLALLGQYIAGSFVAASDGHGGTLVSEEALSATQTPLVTRPHA